MQLQTDIVMKKINPFSVLTVIIFAVMMTSCSTVAFTGRRRLLLYDDGQITSLSDQSYRELIDTVKLSTNVAQTAMVTQVGRRLTSALDVYLRTTGQESLLKGINWEYKLVQSKQVNAFCMPSGKIVFYEGIMPYCTTPDFVAVVMGHEIAHAVARHGNERMSQQAVLNTAGVVASELIGYTAKTSYAQDLFNMAYSVGSEVGVLLPFSRKHELEADEIGLIIMAIAGYDIEQAPIFWQRMMDGGSQQVPELFSTHPSDARRIQSIRNEIPKVRAFVAKIQ
ncbi:MAG: M48 family metallopeptidase [Bacteroidaceae bacterium]|nr:M48 family metallopeptidase [Bacteroidaceae bacterium]